MFLPWPVPFCLRVYLPQEVEISTFFQPLNAFGSQNIFSLIFLTNLEAIKCPTKRSAEAPSVSGAKATEKNRVFKCIKTSMGPVLFCNIVFLMNILLNS